MHAAEHDVLCINHDNAHRMRANVRVMCVLVLVVLADETNADCTDPNWMEWAWYQEEYCVCSAGWTGGNLFGGTAYCTRFVALILPKRWVSSVARRASPATGTLPAYTAGGGPTGRGHVAFSKSGGTIINAGTYNFLMETNGGFTMIAILRLGSQTYDSIFTLESESAGLGAYTLQANLFLHTNMKLSFQTYMDASATGVLWSQTLSLSTWYTVVVRYQRSNRMLYMRVDSVSSNTGMTVDWTDKVSTTVYLGRPRSTYTTSQTAQNIFTGDIAGFFVVDQYLQLYAVDLLVAALTDGVDLTDTTCPSGPACAACAAGKYKPATGSAACVACDSNLTSPSGSSSSAACVAELCNAGYTGLAGSCVACGAGTYKVERGNSECLDCNMGTYWGGTGATAAGTCVACVNAVSYYGSTSVAACRCAPGYTGPGSACEKCAAGKYKDTTGSAPCVNCAAGTFSLAGETTASCLACPVTGDASWQCACASGFQPVYANATNATKTRRRLLSHERARGASGRDTDEYCYFCGVAYFLAFMVLLVVCSIAAPDFYDFYEMRV